MNSPSLELKKRFVTGVLGALLLVAMIRYGGRIAVTIIVIVVSMGMLLEFTSIVYTLGDRVEKRYLLLCLGWFVSLLTLIVPDSERTLFVASFLLLFFYFLITAGRYGETRLTAHFRELSLSYFGLVYLVLLPTFFMRIFEVSHGVEWTILFLFIVWAGDTSAYFVGKKFGQGKLYPAISPKKTREGALGGLAFGILVACVYRTFVFRGLGIVGAIVIAFLVGIFSQVGDLCESFLKRAFDTKDSGTALPGHGGFLDRFDGIVFSLPVMYACVRFFG